MAGPAPPSVRRGGERPRRAVAALGLAATLLGPAVGCGEGSWLRGSPAPETLSLLWISLDTLRADHLGAYGYSRDTSPFLDELARRGLVFDWAIAPQNATLPSHMTMFTGYHPIVHGVMHSNNRPGVRLAESVRTLPQVLRENGFITRARVDGGQIAGHFGFSKGFDAYLDEPRGLQAKLVAAVTDIDAFERGRRFFYLVHTYQVHQPYTSPRTYAKRFPSEDSQDDVAKTVDLYDRAIRFVDDQLRGFVNALEERGVLKSTIVVVTADHGESFAEYEIPVMGHAGDNLHQNITRVPWIIVHPDARVRGRVEKPVGLIDFANTTLAMLGLEERLPGGGVDVLGPAAHEPRSYVSWTGQAWSLYSGAHHLLESRALPGPERNALFHVASDPAETTAIEHPELIAALRSQLAAERERLEREQRRVGSALREAGTLPAETREQLRALGYVVDEPDPAIAE